LPAGTNSRFAILSVEVIGHEPDAAKLNDAGTLNGAI
jgi:hypothetical protein